MGSYDIMLKLQTVEEEFNMIKEPNGCLIGLLEEVDCGYKVYKPYVLTGEQYYAIHDLFLNLNISLESDLCYGNTFAPILYKKEGCFKDNHLIYEKEINDISHILECDFPLICDGMYKNGAQYCINERRINKDNYNILINDKEMYENIATFFEGDEFDFIKTVYDSILKWIKTNKYIYVHVY